MESNFIKGHSFGQLLHIFRRYSLWLFKPVVNSKDILLLLPEQF